MGRPFDFGIQFLYQQRSKGVLTMPISDALILTAIVLFTTSWIWLPWVISFWEFVEARLEQAQKDV